MIFEFSKNEEANTENKFSLPQKNTYEPSAAKLKSGAFKLVGYRFGLEKLHVNTHLFTSDKFVEDFPGRIFLLKRDIGLHKKDVARIVPEKKIKV